MTTDREDRRPPVVAQQHRAGDQRGQHRHPDGRERHLDQPQGRGAATTRRRPTPPAGRRGCRCCVSGPQSWVTSTATTAKSGEAEQGPAQGDEARSVEHTDPFGGGARPVCRGRHRRADARLAYSGRGPAARRIALPHDRPPSAARRTRPRACRPGQARALRRRRGPGALRGRRPPAGDRRLRGQAGRAEAARQADRRRRRARRSRTLLARTKALAARGQGGGGRPGRRRGRVAGGAAEHPQPGRRGGARRRRGRLRAPRDRRHARGVRLRAARPHRARPDARRDRPRPRRQGLRQPLLLPHRRRRRARARADQPRHAAGPRAPASPR